jgi:hypothetical protein
VNLVRQSVYEAVAELASHLAPLDLLAMPNFSMAIVFPSIWA